MVHEFHTWDVNILKVVAKLFQVDHLIHLWVYFFGQPRGHKTNEVNHALEAKYIASALLGGS